MREINGISNSALPPERSTSAAERPRTDPELRAEGTVEVRHVAESAAERHVEDLVRLPIQVIRRPAQPWRRPSLRFRTVGPARLFRRPNAWI